MWRLSYGWISERGNQDRPTHVESILFHSFEACIKNWPAWRWWEIADPDGRVVLVHNRQLDSAACPNPSFCARQILNFCFPGSFPETEVEEQIDMASHDDGASWEPVVLGAKSANTAYKPPSAGKSIVTDLTLVADPNHKGRVLVNHKTGRISALVGSVKIRQSGKKHDLLVAGKVYAAGISAEVVVAAGKLGIGLRSRDALPRAWKPAFFKINQKDSEPKLIKGFTRGNLGIDRRSISMKGYGDYVYQRMMWCLSHIPTGSLITTMRHRKHVEEAANDLRLIVPELTDGSAGAVVEITPEIKEKVRACLAGD